MNDSRIWTPDASCRSAFWNTAITVGGNLGRWRVPDHLTLLWRSVTVSIGATAPEISTCRILILMDTDTLTDEGVCVNVNGSIVEVRQLGNDGVPRVGFAIHPNSGARQLHLPLAGGHTYFPWMVGTPASAVGVTFEGWTFPTR